MKSTSKPTAAALISVICAVVSIGCAYANKTVNAQVPKTLTTERLEFVNTKGEKVIIEANDQGVVMYRPGEKFGAVQFSFAEHDTKLTVRRYGVSGPTVSSTLEPNRLVVSRGDGKWQAEVSCQRIALLYAAAEGDEAVPLIYMETEQDAAGVYLRNSLDDSLAALMVTGDSPSKFNHPSFGVQGTKTADNAEPAGAGFGWDMDGQIRLWIRDQLGNRVVELPAKK